VGVCRHGRHKLGFLLGDLSLLGVASSKPTSGVWQDRTGQGKSLLAIVIADDGGGGGGG
jgi:hypothetical protein